MLAGPQVIDSGPNLVAFASISTLSGAILAVSSQFWSKLVDFGPSLRDPGLYLAGVGRKSEQFGHHLARNRSKYTGSSPQLRPGVGEICAMSTKFPWGGKDRPAFRGFARPSFRTAA